MSLGEERADVLRHQGNFLNVSFQSPIQSQDVWVRIVLLDDPQTLESFPGERRVERIQGTEFQPHRLIALLVLVHEFDCRTGF